MRKNEQKASFSEQKIFYADLRKTKNELSGKFGELKTFLLISTKRLKTKNPSRTNPIRVILRVLFRVLVRRTKQSSYFAG